MHQSKKHSKMQKKYPPNYWLPWQQDTEENIETLIKTAYKILGKSRNLGFEF